MKNYESTLKEIVLADERYIVMTAENRGAMRNLPEILGDRFIDTGIIEQGMIGMAAGLALRGRIPIAHALSCFLTMRAFEFVRTDVGIPSLPVKLVGAVPGFLSDANGPTHQAVEDIALMRGIPSMHVFCPADVEDLLIGLPKLLASPDPVYIRFNELPSPLTHNPNFEVGQAEEVCAGSDVTILVYGMLLKQALVAKEQLEEHGISVRLLNMRMIKPLDKTAVLKAAKETSLLVTLEDHFMTGGLYTAVCELLIKNQTLIPVLPLALDNRWFKPMLLPDVLEYEGFTGPQIAKKMLAKIDSLH